MSRPVNDIDSWPIVNETSTPLGRGVRVRVVEAGIVVSEEAV
jgi:hypothetical protein